MGRDVRVSLSTVGALALSLMLAGTLVVGAADSDDEASPMPMASGMPMAGDMPMASGMPMAGDMPMDGMEMEMGALGERADPADADRTVYITADDQLKFTPDVIDVKVGETVTFVIENTGAADHEFVIGSAEAQAAHEAEMAAGEMEMEDEPNEVELPTGEEAGSLTWHFTEAGETEFGCHIPGHFAAGMVGTITVSE